MGKTKQAKSSGRKTTRALRKPEVVYKVTKRPVKVPKSTKIPPRSYRKFHHKDILSTRISTRSVWIIIFIAVTSALIVVGVAGFNTFTAMRQAQESANVTGIDSSTYQRVQLMGNTDDYPNEIVNYSIAPEDLQKYILKDYQKLKSSCIVNDEFIGSVQYAVIDVESNSYAKISKGCSSSEALILVKIIDRWTVLFVGNSLPSCSEVYAYNIPRAIVNTCETGNITYTNPIP